nr:MAG TPA: hypothetical protein [Caudoviricetes sp.]
MYVLKITIISFFFPSGSDPFTLEVYKYTFLYCKYTNKYTIIQNFV